MQLYTLTNNDLVVKLVVTNKFEAKVQQKTVYVKKALQLSPT
jgi:hypothetical protein